MNWSLSWTIDPMTVDQLLKRRDDKYDLTLPVELWNGRAGLTITKIHPLEGQDLKITNLDKLCQLFCREFKLATKFKHSIKVTNHRESILLFGCTITSIEHNLVISNIGPVISQRILNGSIGKIELEIKELEFEQI
jgi:hypothetical protein